MNITSTVIRPLAAGVSQAQLRIGMIGMGAIAFEHLKWLERNTAVKIVGICDVNDASMDRSRELHRDLLSAATSHADYRQLLKQERPNAVIICSPHSDHFQQVIDSLAAGAHVLVEKPLVNSSEQANEIILRARAAGVVVGIAYQRHTMAPFRFIHDAIRRGVWGAVRSVSAYQQEGWKTNTAGTWRQKPEISGGGYLHDGGSHLVDLALWATGLTPARVSAIQDFSGAPVDVSTVMNIQYCNGALGTLSIMGDIPGWMQRIVIGCDRATVYYGSEKGICLQWANGTVTHVTPDQMPPDTSIVDNFLNAVHGLEEIAAPLECGLAVMKLTEAVVESAQSGGKPVTM